MSGLFEVPLAFDIIFDDRFQVFRLCSRKDQ